MSPTSLLFCTLTDRSDNAYEYSFELNTDEPFLFWIERAQDLNVLRSSHSDIWAEHSAKHRPFDYDHVTFQLSRATGAAKIFYSRKPTSGEIAKRGTAAWCEAPLVLAEYDESGLCQATQP